MFSPFPARTGTCRARRSATRDNRGVDIRKKGKDCLINASAAFGWKGADGLYDMFRTDFREVWPRKEGLLWTLMEWVENCSSYPVVPRRVQQACSAGLRVTSIDAAIAVFL